VVCGWNRRDDILERRHSFQTMADIMGTVPGDLGQRPGRPPPGRIANWSCWAFGALDKANWQAVHPIFA
jgi:hypothetical protein